MVTNRIKFSRWALHALIISLNASIISCSSDDMNDLREFVQNEKAKPAGKIGPLPEIKPYHTYLYQAFDKRDPFSPPSFATAAAHAEHGEGGSGIQPDFRRRREPLEDFSLDTLRMVGLLAKEQENWGLVQASDGTIHRVQPGNYVGQNHGKISAIEEDRISLTELIPNGQGGWLEREAALALSEE